MSRYSKDDIIRMVHEDDVEFIRMQFTDIFGQLKNVAITASQIEKAVNNEIMIDGSSIEGFVRIQESDQYLRPDLDTFTVLPWRPHGQVDKVVFCGRDGDTIYHRKLHPNIAGDEHQPIVGTAAALVAGVAVAIVPALQH